jgi:hypothetical protein
MGNEVLQKLFFSFRKFPLFESDSEPLDLEIHREIKLSSLNSFNAERLGE